MYFSLVALPASPLELAWCAQYISRGLKVYDSLLAHSTSAKEQHLYLGMDTSSFNSFYLRTLPAWLRHTNMYMVKQAVRMTPQVLEKIYHKLKFKLEVDLVFWSALITAFFLLFRKSNLLPNKKCGFKRKRWLCRDNIMFTDENVIVGIRWTKNKQSGNELFTFPLPIIPGSVLCPVTALKTLFNRATVAIAPTDGFMVGVPLQIINILGLWQSDCFF